MEVLKTQFFSKFEIHIISTLVTCIQWNAEAASKFNCHFVFCDQHLISPHPSCHLTSTWENHCFCEIDLFFAQKYGDVD